jgi:hypothetical protein
MCIQGMHWGLQYILKEIISKTFEELATYTHDMELSIVAHGGKALVQDPYKDKDKQDFRKGNKPFSKTEVMESDNSCDSNKNLFEGNSKGN